MNKIKYLFLFLLASSTYMMKAQDENNDYDNSSSEYTEDSSNTYYDENIDNTESEDEQKKPEKKPYVRIIMPFDTVFELITYTDVIEQPESYVDSLYERAKRWVTAKWGVGNKRDVLLYKEDVLYDKFKASLTIPLLVKVNKYNINQNGDLQFTLEMRFKDGKYKFKITNLVHILPENNQGKSREYVYCEYYKDSDKNIINQDRILRGADWQINKMITDLKKIMKDPPTEEDEDEW